MIDDPSDLAHWTQEVLCAFFGMTDKKGLRVYFTPAMKEEVLLSAIEANRNTASDAIKLFGRNG